MSDGLRVIVCGGRDFFDYKFIAETLARFHRERPIRHLFHGNAAGADSLASEWAYGQTDPRISVHPCPADWQRNGRAAGPIRNKNMLGQRPDVVIAFPGGKGTANMTKIARAAGVEVIEVKP